MYNEQYINVLFNLSDEFNIPLDKLYVYEKDSFDFYGGYYFKPFEVDSDENINESFKTANFSSNINEDCILVPNPETDLDIVISLHEFFHYKLGHNNKDITPLVAEYEAERLTIYYLNKSGLFTDSFINYYTNNAISYIESYINDTESEQTIERIKKSLETLKLNCLVNEFYEDDDYL